MTHLAQSSSAVASVHTNEFASFTQTPPDKLPPSNPPPLVENTTHSKGALPGTGGFAGVRPLKDALALMYILSCHQDNCMTYAGSQITNLGFSMEEWIGKPDLRLQHIHEDDLEKFGQAMRHSRSTGEAFSCQYRLYDGCGKLRWFHDEANVVCDESGTPLFFSGIMLDITDKKEMESELNEHRYHLERNVERRTEQLLRSMTLLESCNAALCDKLALAHKELAALKLQLSGALFGAASNDCAEPLCVQL